MGRTPAPPVMRAAGFARTGVYVAEVFLAGQGGFGNSPRSRPNPPAGRLFQPEPDRRGTRGRAKRRADAWPLRPAGRRLESVSFHAGTGRRSQRPRLLAAGDGS